MSASFYCHSTLSAICRSLLISAASVKLTSTVQAFHIFKT